MGLAALTPIGGNVEEVYGLGTLFRLRGAMPAPPGVAVVAIDRPSRQWVADQMGLLEVPPRLPRAQHAKLIDALVAKGAKAIIFDLTFTAQTDDDATFAQAIRDAAHLTRDASEASSVPVVLLQGLEQGTGVSESRGGEDPPRARLDEGRDPTPAIAEPATAIASFPLPRDTERVTRFWTFVSGADFPTLPSVGLQLAARDMAQDWAGVLKKEQILTLDAGAWQDQRIVSSMMQLRHRLVSDANAADRLKQAIEKLPPDKAKQLSALLSLYSGEDNRLLNFYGPYGTISTISYASLIGGPESARAASVAGKIVVVGVDEHQITNQIDTYETVYTGSDGIRLSGAEILATALSNLIENADLRTSASVNGLTVLGVAAFLGLAAAAPGGVALLAAAAALPAVLCGLGYYLFMSQNFVVPTVSPIVAEIVPGLLVTALWLRRTERNLRRRMDEAARQYLPGKVADSLVHGRLAPNAMPEGETAFAICLATDAKGYTAVSEKLSPEALRQLLNNYFAPLIAVVQRRGCSVAIVTADALMCAWTVGEDPSQARLNAVLATLEMRDLVGRFNERNPPYPLPTRFGLCAGLVSFGVVGAPGHYEYRVVGDAPNTASRIEALNKLFRTNALASEEVVAGLSGFTVRPLGSFVLQGKSQAVRVSEVLGRAGENPQAAAFAEAFALGLSAYEKEDWNAALECFRELQKMRPDDGPTLFYLDRTEAFAKSPPAPGSGLTISLNIK
jgi:adenylate cyclase